MARRLPRLLAGALACAALAAPVATAASVKTARRCYEPGAPVRMAARGFAAGVPLTVTLDGAVLKYQDGSLPVTDAAGGFVRSFYAPYLSRPTQHQRTIPLSAATGATSARTRFAITRGTGADFAPARGNPATLRVRFTLWGFALRSGRNARAYLHWIDPHHHVRASVRLGRTRGACGALTSGARRVFPFAAEPGRWVLVIDTHRGYRAHATGPRAKIPVNVRPLSL